MISLDQIDKTVPVLLVEDEAVTATHIESMLFDLGFETVTICLTHKAATLQLAAGQFGLAIFDINVGGMLSFGLISKAIAQKAAVVTISGYMTGVDNGQVFLAKPIEAVALERAIGEAFRLGWPLGPSISVSEKRAN